MGVSESLAKPAISMEPLRTYSVCLTIRQQLILLNISGDSWRARASHICELQFNISYQGLKIDFGGLDKWNINERTRNLAECLVI